MRYAVIILQNLRDDNCTHISSSLAMSVHCKSTGEYYKCVDLFTHG